MNKTRTAIEQTLKKHFTPGVVLHMEKIGPLVQQLQSDVNFQTLYDGMSELVACGVCVKHAEFSWVYLHEPVEYVQKEEETLSLEQIKELLKEAKSGISSREKMKILNRLSKSLAGDSTTKKNKIADDFMKWLDKGWYGDFAQHLFEFRKGE